MPVSHKLVAVAASAALLVTGGTVAVVSNQEARQPVVAAVPAPVTTEVRVWADNATHPVSLAEPTVAAALAAANITLGETDRVSPALDATLTLGDVVTVNRVSTAQETKEVVLEFASTTVKDSTLAKGERKTRTKGVQGLRTDVVETVTVDGTVESTTTVSQTVTREPVNEVVVVGTLVAPDVTSRSSERTPAPKASAKASAPAKPSAKASAAAKPTTKAESAKPEPAKISAEQPKAKPKVTAEPTKKATPSPKPSASEEPAPPKSGAALNLARADMWDRIAQCESTGRWNINTGNGYYGGLQFNLGTWRSVNGTDFAAYPHQASRAEQITVANRLYAQRGLQPWGCRHAA